MSYCNIYKFVNFCSFQKHMCATNSPSFFQIIHNPVEVMVDSCVDTGQPNCPAFFRTERYNAGCNPCTVPTIKIHEWTTCLVGKHFKLFNIRWPIWIFYSLFTCMCKASGPNEPCKKWIKWTIYSVGFTWISQAWIFRFHSARTHLTLAKMYIVRRVCSFAICHIRDG